MKLHYRQIVALNNMGVTLLEREAFQDAMTCFKEAVTGMQTLFAVREKTCTSHIDHSATIEEFHQLISSTRKKPEASVNMQVLSDEAAFSVLNRLNPSQGSTSIDVCHPILIDGFQAELHTVDTYSAILLHNFSTAHLGLAFTIDADAEPQIYKKLLASAQSIAYLAYQTVSSLMNNTSERDFQAQILQDTSVFVTAMASLHVLESILSSTKQESSLEEVWRRRELLGKAICEAGYALEVTTTNGAAAA